MTVWKMRFIRIYVDDELINEIDLSKTINGKHECKPTYKT